MFHLLVGMKCIDEPLVVDIAKLYLYCMGEFDKSDFELLLDMVNLLKFCEVVVLPFYSVFSQIWIISYFVNMNM